MIDHISIRDFAIIDNVDVDFHKGLSIITGETGSGKSILVTAISLALGSRADSSYVRNGKDKALVELMATLDDGEEIIISREVSSSGKNLCRLNGRLVTLNELSEKCKEIADIHGQYDNQSLLNPDNHLDILDSFNHKNISPLLEEYSSKYNDYLNKKEALENLLSMEADSLKRADFYRYEIKEIETAAPTPGEDSALSSRLSLLQNSEKIFESINGAYKSIGEENGAYAQMGTAVDYLERISEYSPELEKILEEARDLYYRMEDLSNEAREMVYDLVYDPAEIDSIIERLSTLDNLKKKYAVKTGSIDEVLEYKAKIKNELSQIENFDDEKKRLENDYQNVRKGLLIIGGKLTEERTKGAKILSKEILKELKDLNFQDAKLDIELSPLSSPTSKGFDKAEILITVNPGEPLKSLAKTSSGGEISRIMLAIKNITADFDKVPTLIFDEIDQGISGRTAAIVGKKLKEIGESHQVICITHLPQIAAQADRSYRIFKESDESNTYTHVEELKGDDRIVEIARLLGGETITESALNNAKELMGI